MKIPVSIVTDAKSKRANIILTQFELIDFIVPYECLKYIEEKTNFSRKSKPLDILNGIYLFDDCIEAYERNKSQCTLVKPFIATYINDGNLNVKGYTETWMPYNSNFEYIESKYVLEWLTIIKDLKFT